MKRSAGLGVVVVLFLGVAAGADLPGDVELVLKDKLLAKAAVGIEIVRLGSAENQVQELYQRAGHTPLTPASNLKLATTSAALDRFGPDFKFKTTLLLHDGDLILFGDGDPSFGDSEYLRRVGWKITTVFENWAERLKKLNVSSIRDVIVDDSIFDEQFLHPHWPLNQIDHWYVAEVGGVNFNANCITFVIAPTSPRARVEYSLVPSTTYVQVENDCVTGPREPQLGRKPGTNFFVLKGETPAGTPRSFEQTIHDPPLYAATVLADTLAANGLRLTGSVRRDRSMHDQWAKGPGGAWTLVGVHQTPLAVALARANKDSVNLYAESLCKLLGHETSRAPGSWENGTAAVGAFLKKAGADETEFRLDDGSGLSKHNAITPHALVRVLAYDYFSRNRDVYQSSLSVSGEDGTLSDRFRGTDLKGRVIGKSGFVEGVSCLSGYLKGHDGQWYAFSIMMNGIPYKSNSGAKALQEKIIRALDAQTNPASARR